MILEKKKLNREHLGSEPTLPIKVVQFGEGNFLRAFVDYAFHELNKKIGFDAGVAVVQPLENGMVSKLNEQDGLFTLFLNGVKKGKPIQEIKLIDNIVAGVDPYKDFEKFLELSREEELQFIISNTTEAGIEYNDTDTMEMKPPKSFPAKLLVFLYERYVYFCGDANKGLSIIPCELINYNADALKSILIQYTKKWNLSTNFQKWISESCTYHNTLVDRIVPGYPRNEIEEYNQKVNYQDDLMVTSEPFFLWVIEGDSELKKRLPFDKTSLDVKIVDDMQPYRTRKVRILNGAHTAMVPVGMLHGLNTVKETVENSFVGAFVNDVIYNEINLTLDMDKKELNTFADEVMDRFRNPFIRHQLADISLNSISKFKVRVLPSMIEYAKRFDVFPAGLTYSFACLLLFYRGSFNGETIKLQDAPEVIETLEKIWSLSSKEEVVYSFLSNTSFWDDDLTKIDGLEKSFIDALSAIENYGVEEGYQRFKSLTV